MKRKSTLRSNNWRSFGFETMRNVKDQTLARQICSCRLQALQHELHPEIAKREKEVSDKNDSGQALCDQLYNRREPVVDGRMFAIGIVLVVLILMFVVSFGASAASHALTFAMFGWTLLISMIVGTTLTAVATAAGHQVYERILQTRPWLHALIAVTGFVLCFYGLFQLAQARGVMTSIINHETETASFVEEAPVVADGESDEKPTESKQHRVQDLLGQAVIKIMLAADMMVGLFLGMITRLYNDDDFVVWRHVRRLKRRVARVQAEIDHLKAEIQTAMKECAAGILEGLHFQSPSSGKPYLKMLPVIALLMLPVAASAQTDIKRHEVILVDTSGSIAHRGQTHTLFQDYLAATRRLLQTEPAQSRVWVQLVTTDSFGAVQTLIKGFTPSVSGVFTDDLDRARQQLVGAFKLKSAQMRQVASGTGFTGGFWLAKAGM